MVGQEVVMEVESYTPDSDMDTAEIYKKEANAMYKEKRYVEAISLYSDAIKLNPQNPVYYSNRSIAYLQIDWYGSALEDASTAVQLDPTYVKGYYRRAEAYLALGRYRLALKDYETVLKARPGNRDAQIKFEQCSKLAKKVAFERAISVTSLNRVPVIETLDIDSMTVEDDYTGPRLVNGKVTEDFVKDLMDTFRQQGKLHQRYAYQILYDVKKYFDTQPTLVDVTIEDGQKLTVCGDIHGQYYDLLNIFDLNGLPSQTNPYLFNGDFVDRGSFSVECIFTLFAYKLLYPNHFYMARGNHESETMNQVYGFEGEVKAKYSSRMVEVFKEVYNCLPLAHCLNRRVAVMHGGLFSRDDVTLDEIRAIERKRQPPEEGLMCEILWSDPQPALGRSPSKRGVGIQFGPDVTEKFLKLNNLDYIIRSHEVKPEGYEVGHDGRCITVFSAPNYCDSMGNKGAFLVIRGDDFTPAFTTFDAVPHPDIGPMAYGQLLLDMMHNM